MKKQFLFLLVCCASYFNGIAQYGYPHLTEICTDQANIMSYEQLESLRDKLRNFESETSHQIVVLTVSNLGDDTIENYAFEVFNENGLGQLGRDNGLLILFSRDDREVRIEVGDGLEPIITDAISSRLIRNVMIPEFKEDRYFEGIDLATDEIINIINDPIYAEEFANIADDSSSNSVWGIIITVVLVGGFLSIFFFIGIFILKSSYKDLVNIYRGVLTGQISVLSFPFMIIGALFPLLFGCVFTFAPLFGFLIMLSQVVFNMDINRTMTGIIDSAYFNLTSFAIVMGVFLVGLPVLLALLIVKRFDNNMFKYSFIKSNNSYIKKHVSFRSSSSGSSSRSSGSSSSSSRSSFSGGGGRSSGGGASGRW